MNDLTPIVVDAFTSHTGITFAITEDARLIDMFMALFSNYLLALIVAETNRYAQQKLTGERLARWSDVTLHELSAYFGVCIVMGLNHLPSVADYWSSNPLRGNEGIKNVMTTNRFKETTTCHATTCTIGSTRCASF